MERVDHVDRFKFPGEPLPDGVHVTAVVTTVYVVEHVRDAKIVARSLTTSKETSQRLRQFYEEMADAAPLAAPPAE